MTARWFRFKYELMLCILLLILFQVDTVIQFVMFRIIGIQYDSIAAHIAAILLHALIFATVIGVGLYDQKKSLVDVSHFKKSGIAVFSAATLCSIGFILLLFYLDHLAYRIFTGFFVLPSGDYLNRFLPVIIINSCLIPAVAEELLFKGVIFTGLKKRYSQKTAVIISSVFFAVCHLNPAMLINHFLFSICTFWLYLRTGSIFFPMMIHFTTNLFATVLIAEPFSSPVTLLAAQIIFWLGFLMLYKATEKKEVIKVPEEEKTL
ncbi:MAG: CPBP family intramembrane metalloprotease [Treponema sp.]|nr:CPBP family intramembrane metalloprotease [Treponema sp.]